MEKSFNSNEKCKEEKIQTSEDKNKNYNKQIIKSEKVNPPLNLNENDFSEIKKTKINLESNENFISNNEYNKKKSNFEKKIELPSLPKFPLSYNKPSVKDQFFKKISPKKKIPDLSISKKSFKDSHSEENLPFETNLEYFNREIINETIDNSQISTKRILNNNLEILTNKLKRIENLEQKILGSQLKMIYQKKLILLDFLDPRVKNFSEYEKNVMRIELNNLNFKEEMIKQKFFKGLESESESCLLYTSPSPRDLSTSRMPSSA